MFVGIQGDAKINKCKFPRKINVRGNFVICGRCFPSEARCIPHYQNRFYENAPLNSDNGFAFFTVL